MKKIALLVALVLVFSMSFSCVLATNELTDSGDKSIEGIENVEDTDTNIENPDELIDELPEEDDLSGEDLSGEDLSNEDLYDEDYSDEEESVSSSNNSAIVGAIIAIAIIVAVVVIAAILHKD